jgi:hypothetical protein
MFLIKKNISVHNGVFVELQDRVNYPETREGHDGPRRGYAARQQPRPGTIPALKVTDSGITFSKRGAGATRMQQQNSVRRRVCTVLTRCKVQLPRISQSLATRWWFIAPEGKRLPVKKKTYTCFFKYLP